MELDIRVEEGGEQQQQPHKGVTFEFELSSLAQPRPQESIKPSQGFGWMDQEDSNTFQSAFGSKKRECWTSALMKRNESRKESVHESRCKVGYVRIYRTTLGE